MPRKPYPSDLSDAQWAILEPLVPPAKPGGRPREVDMREIVNGVLYVLRNGGGWRALPHDLPPWQTVYDYFNAWRKDGTWERIHDALRERVRVRAGREPTPSAAIVDSQSVKTTDRGGVRGYDAGKKVKGRKRHLVVDTLGLLLLVVVHSAALPDRDGATLVLGRAGTRFPRLRLLWADGGYAGQLVDWGRETYGWLLEIVERTLAWLGHYRRLSKDYEFLPATSEALLHVAMIHLMLVRLANP